MITEKHLWLMFVAGLLMGAMITAGISSTQHLGWPGVEKARVVPDGLYLRERVLRPTPLPLWRNTP